MKHIYISMGLNIGLMIRKKNILGTELTLYRLHEALEKTRFFSDNGTLNTIQYISVRMLTQASRSDEYRSVLESMDLVFCAETDILRAAGISSRSRLYEIEKSLYFEEFCKMIQDRKLQVYALTDTPEHQITLQDFLSMQLESTAFTTHLMDVDKCRAATTALEILANEINEVAPAIILSWLPLPYQMQLMQELKPYLNATIWLGLPPEITMLLPSRSRSFLLFRHLKQRLFQKRVDHYQNASESEPPHSAS